MPDMEKRLEAFVRVGHGIVVFPGGVGTAEEILYLLGILLHPDNAELPMPMIMTGPKSSEPISGKLMSSSRNPGRRARKRYQIIIDDPEQVGRQMLGRPRRRQGVSQHAQRRVLLQLAIADRSEFQQPFSSSHEDMAATEISEDLPRHVLAANLRRVFSGIVSGNVRDDAIAAIEEKGPFQINGSPKDYVAAGRSARRRLLPRGA